MITLNHFILKPDGACCRFEYPECSTSFSDWYNIKDRLRKDLAIVIQILFITYISCNPSSLANVMLDWGAVYSA